MMHASEECNFEEAGRYQNYIKSFSILSYKENVIQFTQENKSIVVIERLSESTLKVFLLKGHKVIYSKKYAMGNTEQLAKTIRSNILTHFRKLNHKGSLSIGKEDLDEAQIMYSYLNGSRAKFIVIPDEWIDSSEYVQLEGAIKDLLQNIL